MGTAPHARTTSHTRDGKGGPSPTRRPFVRLRSHASGESRAPLVAPILRLPHVSKLRRIGILNSDELTRPICSGENPQSANSEIAKASVPLLAPRGLHGRTNQKCDLRGSFARFALQGT